MYHFFRKQVPVGCAIKETSFGLHLIPGSGGAIWDKMEQMELLA
jgi:hypothetical protein